MDLNLILTIVFVAILVLIGLASLVGLWKGFWKTSFKTIFRCALFLVIIFCAQPITTAVCSIDLQATFNLNIVIQDVQLTTLDEFVTNLLMTMGNISPVTGQSLYATCAALAHSILSFVIFFVLAILVIIFGSLFSTIFYHLIFKHFISQRLRKKKKIRLLGAMFGIVDGVICALMIIAPISSLGHVVLDHPETVAAVGDSGIVTEDQYKMVDDVITAYDNSILGTVLEYVSPVSDFVMANVVNTEVNGVKINFFDEIDTIIGIADPVIDKVVFEENGDITFKLATLLAKDNVTDVLTLMSKSNLIISLIPGLIGVGTQLVNDPQISDIVKELNFENIDWSNDINAISTFYGKLHDAGLFSELPDLGSVDDIKFNFNLDNVEQYVEAIKSVTEFEVINKNLSSIMAIAARTINDTMGTSLIPENKESYDDLDWSHELVCLTNAAVKLMDVLDINSFDFSGINIQERIMDAIGDEAKLTTIKEALCGVAATDTEEAVEGLLDLKMIDQIKFDNLLVSTLSIVDTISEYVDPNEIAKIINDVKLKDEFSAILDIVSVYNKIPKESGTTNIDLKNPEAITRLTEVIDLVKGSEIIEQIFPSVIRNLLSGANISDDMLFGLSIENINFDFDDFDLFCDELKDILDVVGDAMDLVDALNAEGDNPLANVDTAKVKTILVTLYSSDIINTDHRFDGTGTATDIITNYNFNALITGLLNQDAFKDLNVEVPSDLNSIKWLDTVDETTGEITAYGEISHLINIIDFLKTDGEFLMESNITLDSINGDLLIKTVDLVTESDLMRPSLAGLLNDALQETFASLNVDVDFNRVKSWHNEAVSLAVVLDQLKIIGSDATGALNLEDIDWLGQDSDRLNAMLTALSKLEIMSVYRSETGEYIDTFGNFVSKVVAGDDMKAILGDDIPPERFYCYDIRTGQQLDWAWSKTTGTITKGEGEDAEELIVTTEGEIFNIIDILKMLNKDTIDQITAGKVESNTLESLLNKIIDTETLSGFLVNILENSVLTVPNITLDANNSISINKMNLDVFAEMNKSEQKTEINTLLKIYESTKAPEGSGKSPLEEIMGNIDNLEEGDLKVLKDVLDNLAKLKTFTEPSIGEYVSLHQDTISSILNYVSIDQMVTNNIGAADTSIAKSKMLSIIIGIENWLDIVDGTSGVVTTPGENSKLIDLLSSLKEAGIKVEALTDAANTPPSAIELILTSINTSGLLHQAVPTFIKEIFKTIDIEKIIKINDTIYYPIEYFVHMSASEEDVAYWENEIVYLFELINTLYDESTGKYIDPGTIKFDSTATEGSVSIADLLVPISHIDLLDNNKEYIIYNFISQTDSATSKTKLSDLIRGMDVRYGNPTAARIRKLFFPIGQTDDELRSQVNILSDFLTTMTTNIDMGFKGSGGLSPEVGFNFLVGPLDATYKTATDNTVSVDTYSRSLFASEIIAGFMFQGFETSIKSDESKTTLQKEELIARIREAFYGLDVATGMDYKNINIVEAYGIQGLLTMGSIDFSTINNAVALAAVAPAMAQAFAYMGSTDETVNALSTDISTLSEQEAQHNALHIYTHNRYYRSETSGVTSKNNNSIIATTLLDIYVPESVIVLLNGLIVAGTIDYPYVIGSDNFVFGEFAKALAEYRAPTLPF